MTLANIKKIQDGIRELGRAGEYEIYTGQVSNVDEDNQCVDVDINENLTIPQVRLKMALGSNVGLYVLPTNGSYCVIARMDGGVDYCLLQCSQIDKFWVKIGDSSVEVTSDGVTFNGGNNKGMLILGSSITRWNNLENDVNNLKTAFAALLDTTINTATPGAPDLLQIAMKAGLSAWANQQLAVTQETDVKNDKVKQ